MSEDCRIRANPVLKKKKEKGYTQLFSQENRFSTVVSDMNIVTHISDFFYFFFVFFLGLCS